MSHEINCQASIRKKSFPHKLYSRLLIKKNIDSTLGSGEMIFTHRHNLPYTTRPASLTPRNVQPSNQIYQPKQVFHPKQRSPSAYGDHGIRRHSVGPPCRHQPQTAVVILEVHPRLTPQPPNAHKLVLPAKQRMKRMRHPKNRCPIDSILCIC